MSYDWLAALSLVKILAAFAFFFIYLPTKIFPQRPGDPFIDRFFENLILMTSSAIILVHILALAQLYSIPTLLLCYGLLYTVRVWYREKTFPLELLRTFVVQKTVLTLDVLDRVVDPKASAREFLRKKWEAWKERIKDRQALVHVLLFGTILFYAAALRYADVFRSPAFGYSDPYSHLLWMKQLEAGILYPAWERNGYYPKGFHVFLSILHQLIPLDGAVTIKLVGPLVGVLLVVAVYYTGKKLTENPESALVGMAIFGTSVGLVALMQSGFSKEGILELQTVAHWMTRQTVALSEEFALVFLMPAAFMAYGYLTEKSSRFFILFCLAALMIFMSHPLVAAALGVSLLALGVLSLLLRILTWETFKALSMAGLLTAILGNLQLIYGWLFSPSVVKRAVDDYTGPWLRNMERAGSLPYTLEILTSAGLGLLLLFGGLLFARSRRSKLLWSFLGLYLLLLVFLARSLDFGIKYLIPPNRVGNYRIFLLCGLLTSLFYLATLFPLFTGGYRRRRWLYQAATAVSLATLAVLGFPSKLPAPPRYEYDAFADVSYGIKRSFPRLEWTIVSTTEDYSKVFNEKGWHMNVGDFLQQYDPYEKNLDMPTPYTFFFVEKKLFWASSDPSLNRPGVRLDLERRFQEWSNIYGLLHDDMTIYYEDWDVIVYLITKDQPPKRDNPLQAAGRSSESSMAFLDGIRRFWNGEGSLGNAQQRPLAP